MALDPQGLAIVRIDGPSLVARVHALQNLGGLANVGRHLRSVTLVLPPGAERSVRATLAYAGDDDAALAALAVEEAVGAVSRSKRANLAWLAAARVERGPAKTIVLTAPLPPQLVDGLLQAGSAPLDLDLPREP
jgi:hypothetical protein